MQTSLLSVISTLLKKPHILSHTEVYLHLMFVINESISYIWKNKAKVK